MASGLIAALRDPDLRKKIFFTLTMIILYRIGSQIPTPGIDYQLVNAQLEQISKDQSSVYSLINLFSGGALLQMAIFGIGIMPYITASIIVQLLTVVIPHFEQLKKEGQSGQTKMTQYTRYLTVALALLQSAGIVAMADRGALLGGSQSLLVKDAGVFDLVVMVVVMTSGAVLVMWMGELITDRGVGNGMSLLIFSGIAAGMPAQGANILRSTTGVVFATVIVAVLILIIGVIFIEQGQRRIPVQYAKRMVGRRQYGGSSTYLPLKVNQAGVIPVIFASSVLYLPTLIAQFGDPEAGWVQWINAHLTRGDHWIYIVTYAVLTIFFAYFYVAITFNPEEVADNMKKYGGFIPGIRAGRPTEQYLSFVLTRITFPGSLYLTVVALIPLIALILIDANQDFPFGGTSILIVVGVGLETVKQINSQMQQRHYEGLLR